MAESKKSKIDRLPRSQKNRVRVVARDSWFETDGDVPKSTLLICERVRRVVGQDYIGPAETLAVKLVRYWSANGIFEPEAIYVPGEPGCDEVDE